MSKIFSFSNVTLLVALALSSVAAWYSIIGLTAIFAGAVIPVIIMGGILEIGKITTTVWLRKYWGRAGWLLKLYLVPAVIALALLTSMGIFGFLSKAHMEHGLNTGDSQAKLSLYDEKIKTQRDNIELARKALVQMDNQVDQRLSRGDSENSAERAVQIRRQQAGERTKLQKDIGDAQKEIAKLNEERAPIAAENRKVEAEVGPIKYIAALIYGDNADNNTLEAAVRWVIILLVIVFDPLAIALVLAANASKDWDKEKEDEEGDSPLGIETPLTPTVTDPAYEPDDGPLTEKQISQIVATAPTPVDPINCYMCGTTLINAPGIGLFCPNKECDVTDGPFAEVDNSPTAVEEYVKWPGLTEEHLTETVDPQIEFEGIKDPNTKEWVQTGPVYKQPISTSSTYKDVGDGYVEFEGKKMSKSVLQSMRPDLFILQEDNPREIEIRYGTVIPNNANMGDTFIRVDSTPHRVLKYNGTKWIQIDKNSSGVYLNNTSYLQYLMNKLSTGEYDPDLLSDHEQDAISNYIKTT
jgi:hypothetical protein